MDGGFHAADSLKGLRVDDEMAVTVGAGLLADAGERAEEPLVDLPKHEVILRRPLTGIPLLGERGGALGYLVAIAGSFVVVEHAEEQLVLSVVGQHAKEVAVAHIAGGQAVAVGVDVVDEALQHGVLVLAGDAEEQWQGIARLTARAIIAGVGMVEMAVERGHHLVAKVLVFLLVGVTTGHTGCLGNELQVVDVVGGGH